MSFLHGSRIIEVLAGGVIRTVPAWPDTQAPTILVPDVGTVEEGESYAIVLAASDTVDFSLLSGEDTDLFELDGDALFLPSDAIPAEKSTFVCKLRATDDGGNITDFRHVVTLLGLGSGPIPVILGKLSLSQDAIRIGQHVVLDILGATHGSELAGDIPNGLTLNSLNRTLAGTLTQPGEYNFFLTQLLDRATNSPSVTLIKLIALSRIADISATLAAGAAPGTKIADIVGVPQGRTATFVPTNAADAGKVAVAGTGAQSSLVVGLVEAGKGTIAGTITALHAIEGAATLVFKDQTPPTITSESTATVAENTPFSFNLAANEPVTWLKSGGADAARFGLAGNNLTLPGKNYESPDDANADRVYSVEFTATDEDGNSRVQIFNLTVTNLNDTTANAFDLGGAADVAAGSLQTSAPIEVRGLGGEDSAVASVSGDPTSRISKNGGAFVTGPLTVVNGDTLAVRHQASLSPAMSIDTTLTVGTTSDTFTSTSAAVAAAPVLDFSQAESSQYIPLIFQEF